MQAEIVLKYGGVLIRVVERYDTLQDAVLAWTYGKAACDCERSAYLKSAGVLDQTLGCCEEGENVVQVYSIKPYYVH